MFTVPAKRLLAHAAKQYTAKASTMQDRSASNAAALAQFLSSCVADEESMTFDQARALFAFCMCGVSGALVGMFEPPSYAPQPQYAPAPQPQAQPQPQPQYAPPPPPQQPQYAAPQPQYAPPLPQYAPQPQYAPPQPQRPIPSNYADTEVRGPNGNLIGGGGGGSQGGNGPGTKTVEITNPATGTVQTIVNGQEMGVRPLPDGPLPDQVPPIFGGM